MAFKGEGRGVAKTGSWGDFQGLTEATGGGRGVKKRENWGNIVYGWSLSTYKNDKSKLVKYSAKFVVPDEFWLKFLQTYDMSWEQKFALGSAAIEYHDVSVKILQMFYKIQLLLYHSCD